MLDVKHDNKRSEIIESSDCEKAILRRKMYERIAHGNAIADAEQQALKQQNLRL